jgi:hypothetical protein
MECVESFAEARSDGFEEPIRVALMQHGNFQTCYRTRSEGDLLLAIIIFMVNFIDFKTMCACPRRYLLLFPFAWP